MRGEAMEARARLTSKGQVTIPIEVRRALCVEEGDTLVFEVADAYATMRKRRPTLEVAEEVRARYMSGRAPRPITNREAVEQYFASEDASRAEGVLYVSAGDGTFTERDSEGDSPTIGADDADR
jgi:AbrB family looped-hinge helix DNA binding protein